MSKKNGTPTIHNQETWTDPLSGAASAEIEQLRHPRCSYAFGREALGQVVVQWRISRGLSVPELADDAGCSVEVIKQIERGDGLPSTRHLLTLAELMEVSFDKLLRLIGIVKVENDELVSAALRYLALTSSQSLDSDIAQRETDVFMRLLRAGGS